jgi:hypothetical protein
VDTKTHSPDTTAVEKPFWDSARGCTVTRRWNGLVILVAALAKEREKWLDFWGLLMFGVEAEDMCSEKGFIE